MSAANSLPATLTRQFDLLERRLWRTDLLVALCGGTGALLLSYAALFASDRVWDTPHWLRLGVALCGWAGFGLFGWWYGRRWVWSRPTARGLALIVQRRYRRLGDRLLGIVELADPLARPSNYSAELCHAAIAQVAGEASAFDFEQAASQERSRRYVLGFLVLGLVVGSVAGIAPEAGWNALVRWFCPTADIERYTFVTIDALPDHLVVPQGEPFEIAIGLARGSYWRPEAARSFFDGQSAVEAPIRGGVATFRFPGQTQERLLWLSVGDVTRSVRIQPAVRPDLRQLRVRYDLPPYLHYPPQERVIQGGTLEFLPGTSAVFTGEAVRNLASASLQGEKEVNLAVDGPRFHTPHLLLELERDLTFTWRDTLGLAGATPMTIHVSPIVDQPPAVEVRGLQAAIAVLPEETVPIDLGATDDFGVRRLTFTWQAGSASPQQPPGPEHDIVLTEGQPQAKTLGGHYDFSPVLLDIPPDSTILVRGLAIDYYPGREPTSSLIYRIHVLSRESHARLIHDQLEKLMEQLEELTRRQEGILQAGKTVRGKSPDQLASPDSTQKLGEQSGEQSQTAAQLKELARQVGATIAEALRNPQISPETLKNWASRAEEMNDLAATAMPDASQSLDSAKADAGGRPQKLDQALGKEQAILDAMRAMETQANKDLESLMAQTLAARLRREASAERDLATDFVRLLPDTIGMTPGQMPADPRHTLETMTASHAVVTREAGRIQEEISRLFDRTALSRYGDVARQMDGMKAEDSLAALGKLVEANVGVESIDTARYWSDQFERWAKRLEAHDDSKSSSGGKQGQPDPAQLQALLALMRLRQQQDQLREQTSVLDERKNTSEEYSADARKAGQQQSALESVVQAMKQDPDFPVKPAQLAPVGAAMHDAAGLLDKPETGQPTNAAQTDALNLLDAVIAQQAQSAGQNASALAAMMGMGGAGNGSTAGGTSSQPNTPVSGSREGEAPDQRTVIQAAGVDDSQLPGEFRDAIESYHRAIEKSQ